MTLACSTRAESFERLRADEKRMAGHTHTGAQRALDVQSSRDFAGECGILGTWRLIVRHGESGETEKFDFDQPFVVVGRGSGCQLRLSHPDVGFRHAYFQVIQGRLFCFDLDTETGLRFNHVPRREGFLAARDQLWVGPYSVQLSQAPGFQFAQLDEESIPELPNEPLESIRFRFLNAYGRSSHSPLRPVRRSVTLLGRADRCHLKLSDATVSRVHCALVRTHKAFWIVDLLGREGTRINGRTAVCAPLAPADELEIGRFRMQLCQIGGEQDSVLTRVAAPAPRLDEQEHGSIPGSFGDSGPIRLPAPAAQDGYDPPMIVAPTGGISESVLLRLMEQFARMQQQIMAHTHEQMVVLGEMFAEMQQNQQAAVLEQLDRIREISRELIQLRMQAIQPPGLPAPVSVPVVAEPLRHAAPARPSVEQPSSPPAVASDPVIPLPTVDSPLPTGNGSVASSAAARTPEAGDVADVGRPPQTVGPRRFDEKTAHTWLTERMVELEKEQQSRWHRLMQLIGSQRSAN
jgi:hypothetical protein